VASCMRGHIIRYFPLAESTRFPQAPRASEPRLRSWPCCSASLIAVAAVAEGVEET
jgi:hypothetical protein